MRNVALTALAGLALAGCGGGGDAGTSWRDPNAATFDFGTPTSELTADELSAAGGGLTSALDALAFPGESDPGTADARGMSALQLPRMMSGAFVPVQLFVRASANAPEQPWTDPGCWSVTAAEVRYDRCTRTVDGVTTSMDGSIHRTIGADGVRHVSWDLTNTLEYASGATSTRNTEHYRGELTNDPAARTLVGPARVDITYSASLDGTAMSYGVTYNADLDLTYEVDPSTCVDGGTLTLKRLYSQVPAGTPLPPDAAVQFSWVACGDAGVRIATPAAP